MKLFKVKKEKVNNNKYRIIKNNIEKTFTISKKDEFGIYNTKYYFELTNNNVIEKRWSIYNIDEYSDSEIIELKNVIELNDIFERSIKIKTKFNEYCCYKVIIKENNNYYMKYAIDINSEFVYFSKIEHFELFDDLESAKKYANESIIELK